LRAARLANQLMELSGLDQILQIVDRWPAECAPDDGDHR